MSDGSNQTRAHWQGILADRLPPETEVLRRNAAITASYARWYQQHPQLFKWSGAAAFASHRVGLALKPFVLQMGPKPFTKIVDKMASVGKLKALVEDLELIRVTNNFVWADIGWVHEAYAAPSGGLAAIEDGLSDSPTHARLLEGFRTIERGRGMPRDTPAQRAQAEAIVWQGNALLLEHEQKVTVQAQFAKMRDRFRVFMSLATSMDFDANNLEIDLEGHTSFATFMVSQGFKPNIADVDQRWFWVEHRFLPKWREAESGDPGIASAIDKLSRLAGP